MSENQAAQAIDYTHILPQYHTRDRPQGDGRKPNTYSRLRRVGPITLRCKRLPTFLAWPFHARCNQEMLRCTCVYISASGFIVCVGGRVGVLDNTQALSVS